MSKSELTEKIHKKLKLMSDLFDFVFAIKETQFKNKYPEKKDSEIRKMIIESMEKGNK